MRLRLILGLNLITGSSALAGAWARYAERQSRGEASSVSRWETSLTSTITRSGAP
jgi:hypothetical protein